MTRAGARAAAIPTSTEADMECPDCCGGGGWFDGVSWIRCELCGGIEDPGEPVPVPAPGES